MTDTAVHLLPANTSPLLTDEMYLVGNAATLPTDQKIQLQNVGKGIPIDTLATPTGTTARNVTNAQAGLAPIAPGNTGQVLRGDGTWGSPPYPQSVVVNGGFWFAQRQTPGTLTTLVTDKYSADRWRVSIQSASLQYQRNDGSAQVGLTSTYYGSYKQITNAGKFMVYQPIEGIESIGFRSKTMTLALKLMASSAKTIRIGLIELTNAGTVDTLPATFVSAWGVASTDPTLGANLAYVASPVSCAVTTSWQQFTLTVAMPATSKNYVLAIWTDSQFAALDQLNVAEVMLVNASAAPVWGLVNVEQELFHCQRFYEKSFAVDILPADNLGVSGDVISPVATGGFAAEYSQFFAYKVTKRAVPTLAYYNPVQVSAGTWNWYSGGGAGAASAPTVQSNSIQGFSVTLATNVHTLVRGAWTAECEL